MKIPQICCHCVHYLHNEYTEYPFKGNACAHPYKNHINNKKYKIFPTYIGVYPNSTCKSWKGHHYETINNQPATPETKQSGTNPILLNRIVRNVHSNTRNDILRRHMEIILASAISLLLVIIFVQLYDLFFK